MKRMRRIAGRIKRAVVPPNPEAEIRRYIASGRLPWTRGYCHYRDRLIRQIIASSSDLAAFTDSKPLRARHGEFLDERTVEIPWIFSRFSEGSGRRLLDAGSSLNFDWMLSHPRLKEREVTIATLAPEGSAYWRDRISYQFCDLRNLPFRDDWFDEVCCISTLEHVGMDNALYSDDVRFRESRQDDFELVAREFNRVLRKGGTALITVPFGEPLNYGWFQQFDRRMLDRLIAAFGPSSKEETFFKYDGGWQFSDADRCRGALGFDVHKTKLFDPASSLGYDEDHAAASRAIAALRLVK
jgi:SAM-dependent methyltransferase